MTVVHRALRRLSPGTLSGIRLNTWWRLLRDNRFDVDAAFLPRAAVISVLAVANSAVHRVERLRFGRALAATSIRPPLFVTGLARSGTTLLQELLALDERFATPTLYQVRFPHVFLTTERIATRLTGALLPSRRAQDAVRFGWQQPGEEGDATGAMALSSGTLSLVFPRRWDEYRRLTVPERMTEAERAAWLGALETILAKVTLRTGCPLVLKTPENTARVSALAGRFPDARFVHIHRNPWDVARSVVRMAGSVSPYRRLQHGRPADQGWFLAPYREMALRAADGLRRLPPGRRAELRYEDLVAHPTAALRRVYTDLRLPFDGVEARLRAHVPAIRAHRRDPPVELSPSLAARIATEWRPLFDLGGYAVERAS